MHSTPMLASKLNIYMYAIVCETVRSAQPNSTQVWGREDHNDKTNRIDLNLLVRFDISALLAWFSSNN